MKEIKSLEMGFPDYQKSRRFPRKSSRDRSTVETNPEMVKVPTILKKGIPINQVLRKEMGVEKENGSVQLIAQNAPVPHINSKAREPSYESKVHPRNNLQAEKHSQSSDEQYNLNNYNQNYPQLLQKTPVVGIKGSFIKPSAPVVSGKTLPASNSSANMMRAIEKAREYSSSWVPSVMRRPVKLISQFSWAPQVPNVLQDQGNYLVVGVLGTQSSGKSTLLSHLAGFPPKFENRMLFEAPSLDHPTSHSTHGVDMYITQERMILLDSQAVFSMTSTAVLKKKKRFVGEKHFNHDSVDAQSLQLSAFFLSVCNVIIVVMDWFIDDQIVKLLSISEMLKPKATSNLADVQNPHVVFVLNRASEADWLIVKQMDSILKPLLSKQSLLRFTGMFGGGNEDMQRNRKRKDQSVPLQHNIILMPSFEGGANASMQKSCSDERDCHIKSSMPLFQGTSNAHPSYPEQVRYLRNTMLSLPRDQMFNKLSEKNWLQYAAKAWDLVRKSSFISDYSRLLS